jgi:hypothetical protein
VNISEEITVGNGNVVFAKKMVKLRCGVLKKNVERFLITLEKAKIVLELCNILFSSEKAFKNGFGRDFKTGNKEFDFDFR